MWFCILLSSIWACIIHIFSNQLEPAPLPHSCTESNCRICQLQNGRFGCAGNFRTRKSDQSESPRLKGTKSELGTEEVVGNTWGNGYIPQGHVATVSVFSLPDEHMALKWNLVPESGESYVCHHPINRNIPAVSAGSSGMLMDRRPVVQQTGYFWDLAEALLLVTTEMQGAETSVWNTPQCTSYLLLPQSHPPSAKFLNPWLVRWIIYLNLGLGMDSPLPSRLKPMSSAITNNTTLNVTGSITLHIYTSVTGGQIPESEIPGSHMWCILTVNR